MNLFIRHTLRVVICICYAVALTSLIFQYTGNPVVHIPNVLLPLYIVVSIVFSYLIYIKSLEVVPA